MPFQASTIAALLAFVSIPQDVPPPGRTPPPGRPPEGALTRSHPKSYEVTWEVLINTTPSTKAHATPLRLDTATFFFPVISQSTWSQSDLQSVRMTLARDSNVDSTAPDRVKVDRSAPGGAAIVEMPVGSFSGQSLRATMVFNTTV